MSYYTDTWPEDADAWEHGTQRDRIAYHVARALTIPWTIGPNGRLHEDGSQLSREAVWVWTVDETLGGYLHGYVPYVDDSCVPAAVIVAVAEALFPDEVAELRRATMKESRDG